MITAKEAEKLVDDRRKQVIKKMEEDCESQLEEILGCIMKSIEQEKFYCYIPEKYYVDFYAYCEDFEPRGLCRVLNEYGYNIYKDIDINNYLINWASALIAFDLDEIDKFRLQRAGNVNNRDGELIDVLR